MRFRTLLVAAAMFLAFSAAAFAQGTFQVGSIPVTTVTQSGVTEKTGDISFTLLSGTTFGPGGTITINYGVPITVPQANVAIYNCSGNFAVAGTSTPIAGLSVNSVNNALGQVILNVPAGISTPGAFSVTGVRVQVAGTGLTGSLIANLSSVGNAFLAGQTVVTVINQIAAALTNVGTGGTTVTLNPIIGQTLPGTLTAAENYLDALGQIAGATGDATATVGRIIRFTLSQAPPAGVTVTFAGTAAGTGTGGIGGVTGAFNLVDPGATTAYSTIASKKLTSTSTDLTAYYMLATNSNATVLEGISATATIDTTGATLPVTPFTITYTASMAPIGTAFKTNTDGTQSVITSPIPRFIAAEVGTGTLVTSGGATKTTLLVPFASYIVSSGYNTGLGISNTTWDPGVKVTTFATAVPQTGTVTFYFYNQQVGTAAPTVTSYTTKAGSPGTGLDANGNVPAGSTYSVLLSQLLKEAGFTGDFTGYIFVVTNFTNAHGQYFLSDFKAVANGGQALIINAGRTIYPEWLGN